MEWRGRIIVRVKFLGVPREDLSFWGFLDLHWRDLEPQLRRGVLCMVKQLSLQLVLLIEILTLVKWIVNAVLWKIARSLHHFRCELLNAIHLIASSDIW